MKPWELLERQVRDDFARLGIELRKYADVTQQHDGTGLELLVECKKTETRKAFPITAREVAKALRDSLRLGKDFIFIAENKDGQRVALMDYRRFLVFMETVARHYGGDR